MRCILCKHKTIITNSRYRQSTHETWRRHTCKRCLSVTTTRESLDTSLALRYVNQSGHYEAFSALKLAMSIHEAISHRKEAYKQAELITTTVIARLLDLSTLSIARSSVIDITLDILKDFDYAGYVRYDSQHLN
jgi:transcriptional regulator NrdR family protein